MKARTIFIQHALLVGRSIVSYVLFNIQTVELFYWDLYCMYFFFSEILSAMQFAQSRQIYQIIIERRGWHWKIKIDKISQQGWNFFLYRSVKWLSAFLNR